MRAQVWVLATVVGWSLACGSGETVDQRFWSGACTADEEIVVEFGPMSAAEYVEDLKGEHLVYSGAGSIDGAAHDSAPAKVIWVQCIDENACTGPVWDYKPDEVTVEFADENGTPALFFHDGVFDKGNKLLKGSCIAGEAGTGKFTIEVEPE